MRKQILKQSMRQQDMYETIGDNKPFHEIYQHNQDLAIKEYEHNARLGIQLMIKFKEIAHEEGLYTNKIKQNYFITIRPDNKSITFEQFKNDVLSFLKRKCFIEYTASFEQKGTSLETLGEGFHTHIIAHMTQRSKGEVLRDTQSTFKSYTSANCIEVIVLKTPERKQCALDYITNYTSNDDHKIITQMWDSQWREKLNIPHLYQSEKLPTVKSDSRQQHCIEHIEN